MSSKTNKGRKTLIGVLASHDDKERNIKLVEILQEFVKNYKTRLEKFAFVFTGGTFDRVILGLPDKTTGKKIEPVNEPTRETLLDKCGVLRLHEGLNGGVTILSNLIVKRYVSILWFYLTPKTQHWLKPANLALMRLCDQWSIKRLMTRGSINQWFYQHSEKDETLNLIDWPMKEIIFEEKTNFVLNTQKMDTTKYGFKQYDDIWEIKEPTVMEEGSIALIAHDQMKDKMIDFAIYYEKILKDKFEHIFTTGTTGKLIADAVPLLKEKIIRFHSGPKGGDIEIASLILFGKCHLVVFFIDPLNPHPHIDDIRTVFAACMIHDDVHMLSNEIHAREWFETMLRER